MSEAAVQPQSAAPINAMVPMIHVADIERSAKFYELLGFQIGNYVPREAPPMHWAWLYQPGAPNWKTGANLMLVRSKERSSGEQWRSIRLGRFGLNSREPHPRTVSARGWESMNIE